MQENLSVLVVDDEMAVRKLLQCSLEEFGHQCQTASDVSQALRLLAISPFDAVVSDLNMPGSSGLDLFARLSAGHPGIPLVLLTGVEDVQLAVDAIKSGVSDYLVKPFRPKQLIDSITRAVCEKRTKQSLNSILEARIAQQTYALRCAAEEIKATWEATLQALGVALDIRDNETEGHCQRVSHMSQLLARTLGIEGDSFRAIQYGSYLHDIGKIGIPDAILLKPGPLNPEELATMRSHVEIGYQMVRSIPFLQNAAEIIRAHHESYDGSGYPRGLKGEGIPPGARIFAIADTVDAITSDRPYRKARPFQAAKDEIIRCSGTQFDPKLVDAFLTLPIELLLQPLQAVSD